MRPIRKPLFIDYVYLFGLAILWSTSFAFIKVSIETIPPVTMTAYRLFFAVIALLLSYVFMRGGLPKIGLDKKVIFTCSLSALIGNIAPFSLIAFAETQVPSSIAAVLMSVMPLTTIVLAHLFTNDEKLNRMKLVGVFFGLAGMLVLIGFDIFMQNGKNWFYQLLIAFAAICYAWNSIIMKKLSNQDKIVVAIVIMFISFLGILPLTFFLEGNQLISYLKAPAIAQFSVFSLGAIHAGFATIIVFKIMENCGAGFFAQVNFIIPILGVFWGVIFLSEAFTLNILFALCLILLGIYISRRGQN